MKTRNKNIIVIVGSILVGLLLGWFFFTAGGRAEEEHIDTATQQGEETIWTCSMHPQIQQNEPGDCPLCGMDLIPLQNEDTEVGSQAVYMSENALRLANVQTMQVGAGAATKEVRLNGRVSVDERKVYAQTTHIPGRIERLMVNFTGEDVRRGQTLATVYSPEMITAQEELLQAYTMRESQPELFQAAKEKLRSWRIGENQINQILERQQPNEQFAITADVGGIVTEKLVELGDYVERGMPLYEIADLSTLWILFDLYENNMAWIEEGSTVEFTVASIPGETFEGEIDFIDPVVNRQTRVSTARIEVDNSNGRLKPEMFVSGVVKNPVESTSNELTVPRSAVLWTGPRSVVYVKQNSGGRTTFGLREVVLGPSLGDSYVISEGLQPGEEIVVNGAFTVDAAAQLAGKSSMMNPKEGGGSPGQENGGMDMQIKSETGHDLNEEEITLLRNETPAVFKEQFNEFIQTYLNLKRNLVEGDVEGAEEVSENIIVQIEKMDAVSLSGHAEMLWNENKSTLDQFVTQEQIAATLKEKRENFVSLSQATIRLAETFGAKQPLYIDYCPMANSDKGAFWLSEIKEIRNPYFGDAMLSCGEVVSEVD